MVTTTTASYRIDPQPLSAVSRATDAAELLRRMTAALAHNVNNALVGVISYLELSLREVEPGSSLHTSLTQGLNCALRAAHRVRRTVAFARRAETQHATTVCLREAAEQAVRQAALDRPGLRVVLHANETPCLVRINEPLLHLVLEQVVSNAIEAMPDGGTLTLRVWDEEHRRCLTVADSGPGLAPEVRRHLFEPFFTTKSFGHLGLGLSLCRDVIEAQGGALHIASAEGHGTTATLSFPPMDNRATNDAAYAI